MKAKQKGINKLEGPVTDVPIELPERRAYVKCPGCRRVIDQELLARNLDVCPRCGHHLRLGARARRYPRGSAVLRVGDVTTCMGLVLEGAVRLEKEDYWGNRTILASFGPGQSFAEVYACEPGLPLDLNVVAAEGALVLLMDVRRVTSLCPASCAFHARLVRNLLGIVARRAHALTRKIEHTSQRTTRAKLLSYLSDQAKAAEASRFAIPFDRQELADYLSVDRSAMCAELSRMRKAGIIDFHKNVFELGEGSTL